VNDPLLNVVGRALTGLARRQEAISGNLANVDTPGYRPRQVEFEAALAAELARQGKAPTGQPAHSAARGMLRTDERHFDAPGAVAGEPAASAFDANLRADRNTVDVDQEMTELIDTQLRYGALTKIAASRLSSIREVLRR
jgi:flagellar basal-body rod protein FlgB